MFQTELYDNYPQSIQDVQAGEWSLASTLTDEYIEVGWCASRIDVS